MNPGSHELSFSSVTVMHTEYHCYAYEVSLFKEMLIFLNSDIHNNNSAYA